MKTVIYKKSFGIIFLAITSILPSCYPEYDQEIIKKLEAPAGLEADARRGGMVTLTWAPVDGAVGYSIYCHGDTYYNHYISDAELISSSYRIGFSETTTFSHYNKNWKDYEEGSYYNYRVSYGVCMVDEQGNVGPLESIRVAWPKQ